MSERDKRQQQASQLDEQIAGLENLLASSQKDLGALNLAREILNEAPRKVTECTLRKHYALTSQVSHTVTCSECHGEVFGYEPSWKFCPVCGSTVISVTRENDPTERLQQAAIDRAVKELITN